MNTFRLNNEKACDLVKKFLHELTDTMESHGLRSLRLLDDTGCVIVYVYDTGGYVGVREDRVLGFYLDDDGDLLMRTVPYSRTAKTANDVVTGPGLPDSGTLEDCTYAESDFVNWLSILDLSEAVQMTCDSLDK